LIYAFEPDVGAFGHARWFALALAVVGAVNLALAEARG